MGGRHGTPADVDGDPKAQMGLRVGFLDGIRGLAALYVVLHHIWLSVWHDFPHNDGPTWTGWLVFGHLAVAVFIVVSGFSLGMGPSRNGDRLPGLRTFLRRRAWRILPPYWAALLFSALVYGVVTGATTGHVITARSMGVHALLLQDVVSSPTPNGAFWSIAVEWQIYFLFPLVLLAVRWRGRWVALGLACATVVLAQFAGIVSPALHSLQNLTPQFFAMFVMGVVAARAVREPRSRRTALLPAGAAIWAVLAVAAGVVGSVRVVQQYFWVDLVAGAGTALVLAGLCDTGPIRARTVLGSAPLRRLGQFSYSSYLVHLPILWLVDHFLLAPAGMPPTAHFLALLALCVPCVLAGSYAFHLVFERPFMRHRSARELATALRSPWTSTAGTAGTTGPVGPDLDDRSPARDDPAPVSVPLPRTPSAPDRSGAATSPATGTEA